VKAADAFREMVARPEEDIDLAEACLLIAAQAQPGLDVAAQKRRLDAIAVRSPPGFEGLRRYLFEHLRFTGNTERYDDPSNSFLNEVLDRRTGLPITLCILTMEVGARIGIPIAGIGMPAHFLVRHEDEPRVYLDPFHGGEILDEDGCRARFAEIVGSEVPFDTRWLRPATKIEIVGRVLGNLKGVYASRSQWRNVEWVVRARLAIPQMPVTEARDLARALTAQARFGEAAETLEAAAAAAEDDEDRTTLAAEAVTIRARLN
jgi:regulator of sirC expression with transglutaminase-like and TPR domain